MATRRRSALAAAAQQRPTGKFAAQAQRETVDCFMIDIFIEHA
jgi:hypothetical protein